MAGNDYNPIGGTSQSTITRYHMQMADIDRQLYETGRYTGPVPDLKKGVVETKTLDRKEAQQLKNLLWYQADRLEGYSWSERHARKWYEKLAQGIAGFFKLFNIPYQIRRYRAQKLYDQAAGNVYQNESLYEMAAAIAQTQAETSERSEQAPAHENKENNKSKEKAETKEFDPTKAKSPLENKGQETPSKSESEKKHEPEQNQDEPVKTDPKTEQIDKDQVYKERFYNDISQLTTEGMSKEDAAIKLISENPVKIYNIEQQDITPKIAAHAIVAFANKREIEPNVAMLQLIRKVPAIIQADQKLDHSLDSLFKVTPTAIEHNPEALRYIQPEQINQKTIKYTLGDIRNKKGEAALEAFLDFAKTLDNPGALKFQELVNAELDKDIPPQQPAPPSAPETPYQAPQQPVPPQTPPVMPTPPVPPMPPQTPPLPPTMPEAPEVPPEVPVYDTPPDIPYDLPENIEEEYDNWRYNPEIADAMEKIEAEHPELFNYPEDFRDEVELQYLITDYPKFYSMLDIEDKSITVSAIAVMYDVEQIAEVPFTIETLCEQVTKVAKTKDIEELEFIIENIETPRPGALRNEETEMIKEAVVAVKELKEQEISKDISTQEIG